MELDLVSKQVEVEWWSGTSALQKPLISNVANDLVRSTSIMAFKPSMEIPSSLLDPLTLPKQEFILKTQQYKRSKIRSFKVVADR